MGGVVAPAETSPGLFDHLDDAIKRGVVRHMPHTRKLHVLATIGVLMQALGLHLRKGYLIARTGNIRYRKTEAGITYYKRGRVIGSIEVSLTFVGF